MPNQALYATEGDAVNAGLSAASIIPIVGDFTSNGKLVFKGGKWVAELGEEAAEVGIKQGDNVAGGIKNVYNSIKDAPKYPDGFTAVQNGMKKVPINDMPLLAELKKVEQGEWKKVYKDGYDAYGNKISVHYFESRSGKVFDVEVKSYWSN